MTTAKKDPRGKPAPTAGTAATAGAPHCELCTHDGGDVLWSDKLCRVVLVADPEYAGFCRVIWNEHVREMTDLNSARRAHCMRVVFAVEQALRRVLEPHKINLASFGNLTPHMHWHVIPRDLNDAHFPNAVWGERRRPQSRPDAAQPLPELRVRLAAELLHLL